jgi:hypothetical protein
VGDSEDGLLLGPLSDSGYPWVQMQLL